MTRTHAWRTAVFVVMTAWAATTAVAQEPPAATGAAVAAGDFENAILLDESPLFLRFEISADGKGFRAAWREYVERLFAYLDQDGDGSLAGKEIARSNIWRARLQGNQALPNPPAAQAAAPAPAAPEKPIPRDEWLQAVTPTGEHALFIGQAVAATASQPLWTRLDKDSDGALSGDELSTIAVMLGPLDTDEDEVIVAEELTPYQVQQFGYVAAANAANVAAIPGDDAGLAALVRELFRQYDRAGRGGKGGNRRLEPQEIRIEQAEFDRADGDHDGSLNRVELTALLRAPPAGLTAKVRFGGGANVLEITPPAGLPRPPEKNADGLQSINLPGMQLQLTTADSWPQTPDDRMLEGQFRALDRDGNGQVDAAESQMQPFLKEELEALDRDADGRLTLAEALPFFHQQAGLSRSRIMITTLDQGRVLFSAIDADHDGRLGVREQRNAAGKLPQWDANGDGRVTEAEIPHQVRITVARTMPMEMAPGQQPAPYVMMPQNFSGGHGGPRWFQRMDRNGDGDLSLREFLPGPQRFAELDTDQDGLIDAREAEKQ